MAARPGTIPASTAGGLASKAIAALADRKYSAAEDLARQAVEADQDSADGWDVYSIALYRAGKLDEAIEAAGAALAIDAQPAARQTNLGVLLKSAGRLADAEAAYRRAIASDPSFSAAHHNLGNLLNESGRVKDAIACFTRAIDLHPDYSDAWHALGLARQKLLHLPEAAEALRKACEFAPDNAQAWSDFGTCLMAQDKFAGAESMFRKAIAVNSQFAPAYGNLGAVLTRRGHLIEAEQIARRAVELAPNEHRWLSNLAGLAKDLCDFDRAEQLYRRALALRPDYALGHSNLLFCLNYHPDKTGAEIFTEYRRYDDAHARPHLPTGSTYANTRDPDRKLRIAYLSPDFREHSARHFIEPLLIHHDRSNVEIYCYGEVLNPDRTTARLRTYECQWRSTVGLSNDDVAALLRDDLIDIAIDLGGHTASSRLLALSRRPAPIQIAHFLGHGYTSGLSCMDVFIADHALAPAQSDELFAESIARLDRIPLAYLPPEGMPDIADLPALTKSYITFGYFGRPERLNDVVVEAWSAILKAVPGSKLRLNAKAFSEAAFCDLTAQRFALQGVSRAQLELVFTSPQPTTWKDYANVDIALDPFPHNAGTTTIEALWLGVPSISLAGRPSVGRFGASIMTALQLDDWVAEATHSYISLAIQKASDLTALAELRRGMRDRFIASPLYDGQGLTQSMEALFRKLWREYCLSTQPVHAAAPVQQAPPSATSITSLPVIAENLKHRLQQSPRDIAALVQMSDVCRRLGQLQEAERSARMAMQMTPHPAAAHALGNALAAQNKLLEAEQAYTIVIDQQPNDAEALNNRALALMRRGQFSAAERDLRRALQLRPDLSDIAFNIATVVQDQGRIEEAIDIFRKAALDLPHHSIGRGMMLFTIGYDPRLNSEQVFAEFRKWNDDIAALLTPKNPAWANSRHESRRLKIGYVSGEFGNKSARHYIAPMLAAHDRSRFEVFCYADVLAPDAQTEQLKNLAERWRSTVGLSDEAVADLIRSDAIDVLIDLGGHGARNRLLALARKPAPVQIAHFLGHGYTSGLTVMDAFLADDRLAPEGTDGVFSEPLVRLPRIPIAYSAAEDMPEPTELPALWRGYVTFGHFGRPVRLNADVISAWAEILNGVANSRLVLNSLPFADEAVRERYWRMFEERGVTRDRIDLILTVPQSRTWSAYGGIDISLDPFPHNGGATTIEALWLGVPTVTLKARAPMGRFGDAIMSSAGLDDWIAKDIDQYIEIAIQQAQNIEALGELRAGLRNRMRASPLCDGAGLTKELEATYTSLWQGYCDRQAEIDALQAEAANAYSAGSIAHAIDKFGAALAIVRRADILSNYGAALRAGGRIAEAETAYAEAIERDPTGPAPYGNLGNLFMHTGRIAEAEPHLKRAAELLPQNPEALRSYAVCLLGLLRLEEAEAFLTRAKKIAPQNADIRDNLAQVLRQRGRPVAAANEYREAAELIANNPRALNNMASLEQDLVNYPEAIKLYRRALELRPDYAMAHANLLFCLNYDPAQSAEDIFAEYCRFDDAHARRNLPANIAFANDPSPLRRLRIGYMSPDFREHSARHFIEPILAHHDASEVEVYCYAEVIKPDATTERLKSYVHHWRSTAGASDEQVAAMIRNDRIDILIDFGGHTASSRLLVMSRKPAPVQIAHLLGHGYTSGLSSVDAFLADDELAPIGSESLFAERLVRLPRLPLAYQPPASIPEVSRLPALSHGKITFGHFGRPERLNDDVIAVWSEILKQVPDSMLMLNSRGFSEPEFCDLMAGRFARHGVTRDRLDMVFTSPQSATWDAYGKVDIALDPFPHNAGTTTIEALWLGVPVVTMRARPSVGRLGASILTSVGLTDCIADSNEDYVDRAVYLTLDIPALAEIRSSLRERFKASPLFDGSDLVRSMEAAYRQLWTEWCGKQTAAQSSLADAIKAYQKGDIQAVTAIATSIIEREPHNGDALHIRGIACYKCGNLGAAAQDLEVAIAIDPNRAEWRWNLAAILRSAGQLARAEQHGRTAVTLSPDAPEAHNNLASILKDLGRVGEAEAHYRKAIALRPNYADAWSNLAWTLAHTGHARQAEGAAKKALELSPNDANTWNNLGTAYLIQDKLPLAAQCFAKAVALKPSFDTAHSNYLFCLNYRTDVTAEAIFAAYREWNDVHAKPVAIDTSPYLTIKDTERPLRIGYVSADFRHHAASFFVEPMIAAHDRENFSVFIYSDVANPDATTERYQALADGWRQTAGLSHDHVANLIRNDAIDVLVDLSGHTAGNRLLTFARRPAPIQIAHMVGSGMTTGLDVFDGFFADAEFAPEGADHLFSEPVIRLSRIPLVYSPPQGMPEVAELPALERGYITFGCFSRTARLNDNVLEAWSRILAAIPSARLVLNSKPFQESETREEWTARFEKLAVAASRIDLTYTSPQPETWKAYGGIDIALDPFPHNAGTTTIEALWMGVPVVSLASRPPVGRFGRMILGSLGMEGWVSDTIDEYVEAAVYAASDLQRLSSMRRQLRDRFVSSPLGNNPRALTQEMENIYRNLWRAYCARS